MRLSNLYNELSKGGNNDLEKEFVLLYSVLSAYDPTDVFF